MDNNINDAQNVKIQNIYATYKLDGSSMNTLIRKNEHHCFIRIFGSRPFQPRFENSLDAKARWHTINSNVTKLISFNSNEKSLTSLLNITGVPEFLPIVLDGKNLNIVKVCTGLRFILFLTESGEVFVFGTDNRGELGLDASIFYAKQITKIKFEEPIIDIAVGHEHAIALSECGNLYGWGNAEYLGICKSGNIHSPKLLNEYLGNQKISIIGAADTRTVAITANKAIYVTGKWYICAKIIYYVLVAIINLNPAMEFMGEIAMTTYGAYIHISSTLDNSDYSWLYAINDKLLSLSAETASTNTTRLNIKQIANVTNLCITNIGDNVEKPLKLAFSKIKQIRSGYDHVLLLTKFGTVYSWGYNNWGQCGHSNYKIIRKPMKLNLPQNVQTISAGGNSSACIIDNMVYVWGSNRFTKFFSPEIHLKQFNKNLNSQVALDKGISRINGVQNVYRRPQMLSFYTFFQTTLLAICEEYFVTISTN